MKSTSDRAAVRILYGALAGCVGTAIMTASMRSMHAQLPARERYPLPPREITGRLAKRLGVHPSEQGLRDGALLAHYGYGALTGALLALVWPRASLLHGGLYGVAVWAGSYFGWAPAGRILKPAHRHPWRRNALMITAHLIWGVATAWTLRDGRRARETIFRQGRCEDTAP